MKFTFDFAYRKKWHSYGGQKSYGKSNNFCSFNNWLSTRLHMIEHTSDHVVQVSKHFKYENIISITRKVKKVNFWVFSLNFDNCMKLFWIKITLYVPLSNVPSSFCDYNRQLIEKYSSTFFGRTSTSSTSL